MIIKIRSPRDLYMRLINSPFNRNIQKTASFSHIITTIPHFSRISSSATTSTPTLISTTLLHYLLFPILHWFTLSNPCHLPIPHHQELPYGPSETSMKTTNPLLFLMPKFPPIIDMSMLFFPPLTYKIVTTRTPVSAQTLASYSLCLTLFSSTISLLEIIARIFSVPSSLQGRGHESWQKW